MARSRKQPWVKDPSNSWMKKIAARRYRRIVKQLVKPWRNNYLPTTESECWGCECRSWGETCPFDYYPMEPALPHPYEITNPWSVCDWKYYADWDIKWTRK